MATTYDSGGAHGSAVKQNDKLVIGASSLGTVFEWYDFYLYGLLATYISRHFFSGVNETTGFILALGAFAAGFAVRPFGAIVFGRIGDIFGRVRMYNAGFAIFTIASLALMAVAPLACWGHSKTIWASVDYLVYRNDPSYAAREAADRAAGNGGPH